MQIDTVSFLKEALDSADRPRYKAIAEALASGVSGGSIGIGTKLPAHRRMASLLGVTPGTVSRAYGELERLGLLRSRIGDGTYVAYPGDNDLFRNAPLDDPRVIDLSRNTQIPGEELELLAQALRRLGQNAGALASLNEYTPDTGLPHHRAAGARWLRHSGARAEAGNVMVTNGAQHGLMCALTALLSPEDMVASEALTYPGLLAAAQLLHTRLSGVDMDAEGIQPEALARLCRTYRIRLLYCSPTLQNPSTAVMSETRRREIVSICREYNLLIIEDDAHGVMVEDHPPSLAALAPERTVLIGSLSKAVSTGLRVGYLTAPSSLLPRIAAALRTLSWMATPLTHEIAARWVLDGTADMLRTRQQERIRHRKALVEPLLAGLNYRTHVNCSHFLIDVPAPRAADHVTARLAEQGILVKGADAFAVSRALLTQQIRVSVSGEADEARLVRAFARVARMTRGEDDDNGAASAPPSGGDEIPPSRRTSRKGKAGGANRHGT